MFVIVFISFPFLSLSFGGAGGHRCRGFLIHKGFWRFHLTNVHVAFLPMHFCREEEREARKAGEHISVHPHCVAGQSLAASYK